MKLTYYGHACFSVNINGKHILFDPFITPNPLAKNVDIDTIAADYIFISHGHFDHVNDAVAIAKRTGAKVVANWEIKDWFIKNGIENVHPLNPGGQWLFDFGWVKGTIAQHSSSMPDGSYGGVPGGFIFKTKEGNFYYSGDTGLTLDMQLVPKWVVPDFAVFPIGDNLTMGVDDAIEAAKMVNTTQVVGVHYDTFGLIMVDHKAAVEKFKAAGITLHLAAVGSTIDL
ncbi:metal-dependent hydrolase [Mucilaginibacter hurinus]|uniref:Metal-dependent hydrolase n=1 Tax=Mucilaginibacter hurinus TaxID=2201324 RepID=A0A367GQP8_9SPHI|nr:metal-dependent hydrolase [Mucilaginibacter hurinus]RCH55787.1 metal-dependent hydrolase [Mucilaginibacter hurinus]